MPVTPTGYWCWKRVLAHDTDLVTWGQVCDTSGFFTLSLAWPLAGAFLFTENAEEPVWFSVLFSPENPMGNARNAKTAGEVKG